MPFNLFMIERKQMLSNLFICKQITRYTYVNGLTVFRLHEISPNSLH